VQRQPIARPIEPAKPEETFAARVADVPDTPPEDAKKDDPSAGEAASTEDKSATSAAPASGGEAGAGPASSTTNAPAIAPPVTPAEAAKGKG
jgi:hypothetical protein